MSVAVSCWPLRLISSPLTARCFARSSPFAERVAAFVATRPEVKLIAEPWDASQDSYHLGGFPQGWSEWNDRFREGVPAFWARQFGLRSQGRGDVGGWLTGSRDVFADRATLASVDY